MNIKILSREEGFTFWQKTAYRWKSSGDFQRNHTGVLSLSTWKDKCFFFRFVTSVEQRNRCTTPWGIEYQIFAFGGLDPLLRLCVELGHEVVGNLDSKLIIFLILFINPQETDLKSSTRLNATEDWNSIQKAFKDAYPCEGHMIHSLFSTN